jgi:hypothetical protein
MSLGNPGRLEPGCERSKNVMDKGFESAPGMNRTCARGLGTFVPNRYLQGKTVSVQGCAPVIAPDPGDLRPLVIPVQTALQIAPLRLLVEWAVGDLNHVAKSALVTR